MDVADECVTTGCKPATASAAVEPATGSATALSNPTPTTILLHRRSTALAAEVSAKPSSRTLTRIPEEDSTNALLLRSAHSSSGVTKQPTKISDSAPPSPSPIAPAALDLAGESWLILDELTYNAASKRVLGLVDSSSGWMMLR